MLRIKRVCLSGILFSMTLVISAPAGNYQLAHTFQRANPEVDDAFGTAVVMERGVIAIKSDSASRDGNGVSVTHVFEQLTGGGWAEAATLTFDNGDDEGNYYLGQELAIDNGVIAITYTEPRRSVSRTPIHFATRDTNGWNVTTNEPTFIRPRDPNPPFARYDGTRLAGRVIELSDDFAIIDAESALRRNGSRGAARIFERSGDGLWREQANLVPALYDEIDFWPYSVAIDGETAAVIGVGEGRTTSGPPGGLFFFEREPTGEWSQAESFLDTADGGFFDYYKTIVEIDGDTAAARELDTGKVTLYRRGSSGWEIDTEIEAPFSGFVFRPNFGFAIEDDLLALSVTSTAIPLASNSTSTSDSHSSIISDINHVELYKRDALGSWSLIETIHDPEPQVGRAFGSSLAINQGRLLIGASSLAGYVSQPPGAAYLYVLVPEPSTAILLTAGGLLPSRRRPSSREGEGGQEACRHKRRRLSPLSVDVSACPHLAT